MEDLINSNGPIRDILCNALGTNLAYKIAEIAVTDRYFPAELARQSRSLYTLPQAWTDQRLELGREKDWSIG